VEFVTFLPMFLTKTAFFLGWGVWLGANEH